MSASAPTGSTPSSAASSAACPGCGMPAAAHIAADLPSLRKILSFMQQRHSFLQQAGVDVSVSVWCGFDGQTAIGAHQGIKRERDELERSIGRIQLQILILQIASSPSPAISMAKNVKG